MANKTWFITGTSRGFGREWTKAALERGDQVAATARDPSTLDDLKTEHGDALLPLILDVTSREAAFSAVDRGHLGVPERRHLSRLEVGSRGDQSGARPGGQGVRDQRHAGRARRVFHRLEWSVVQALGAQPRLRRTPRAPAALARQQCAGR